MALSKGTIFAKNTDFVQKKDINKINGSWYKKRYFLKLHMCVYFRTKFSVSRINLWNFRE